MEITVNTKYDQKAITALCHLSMFRKRNPKKRMTLLTVVYAIMLAYIVGMKLWLGDHFSNALPIFFFFAVLLLLMLYSYYIVPRMQYKNLSKRKDTEQIYTFTENGFTVTCESELYQGTSNITYSLLFKAMDTQHYLFLYQDKRLVFIVDKSTLSQAQADTLRAWIAPVLGKQYIDCDY